MFFSFFRKIFGTRNSRLLKSYNKILFSVNSFEETLSKLSDDDLKKKTSELKNKLNLLDSDEILPEAYALVREASKRVLGMRHYDVQILAGVVLYYCKISEVATGEGKTLIATLPAYLNALRGNSVHIVTVNDYLAKRDADWMGPVYEFLGLRVGVVLFGMNIIERRYAYSCDVVYGTNNEFGFDYLRDNISLSIEDKVQSNLDYVVIDEVDSILIDEARTPLVISSSGDDSHDLYILITKLVSHLKPYDFVSKVGDYVIDEKFKQVQLVEGGFIRLEKLLKDFGILKGVINLYDSSNIGLLHVVYSCLKANVLFKKNVDYIVKDNKVLIIDEHTGRIMDGRRWSDGIHQAIESKEGVDIQSESQTLASITFQNYFKLYKKLSGMTGTAYTEAFEFYEIYNLEVVVVPSNKPNIRIDHADLIYLSKDCKFKAIIDDIKECVSIGRPILVGTVSIEVSEYISCLLIKLRIKHSVLNAKYHDKESYIVSEAGKLGAVTIATNMAGRGTDIVLGGGMKFLSIDEKSIWYEHYIMVVNLGGLKVIGTERHESRRIDNQLRGRCARQGDPGSSQFYLSLEDSLVRIFINDKMALLLNKLSIKKDEAIAHSIVSRSIENAQRQLEGHNFNIRKQLLEFDDVVNVQRKLIYDRRNSLIASNNISSVVFDILKDVLFDFIDFNLSNEDFSSDVEVKKFLELLNIEFGSNIFYESLFLSDLESFKDFVVKKILEIYGSKEVKLGFQNMRVFEKVLFLNILDVKWKEHLVNLEQVKKSIHLRGYAQKDPKSEYKNEAFKLFENMLNDIKYEFIMLILKFPLDIALDGHNGLLKSDDLSYSHSSSENISKLIDNKPFIRDIRKIGRNSVCYCGSNIKYKKCHGKFV
ncbi:MAG TPA: preprotein translocase subunit SecA [Candidatus Azoamicus sp. OHIO1]